MSEFTVASISCCCVFQCYTPLEGQGFCDAVSAAPPHARLLFSSDMRWKSFQAEQIARSANIEIYRVLTASLPARLETRDMVAPPHRHEWLPLSPALTLRNDSLEIPLARGPI